MKVFKPGKITVLNADAKVALKDFSGNYFDGFLADAPYEISYLSKKWDGKGIVFNVDMWKEVYRVLKPGAYLLCYGGTRTYHRLACAIEDAGFQIRDCLMWLTAQGFPKITDISKQLQKKGFDEEAEKWRGYSNTLKPAYEPIVLAMKPIEKTYSENVLKWGVGGLNIEESKIRTDKARFPANLLLTDIEEHEWSRFFFNAKTSRREKELGLDSLELKTKTNEYAGFSSYCKVCGKMFFSGDNYCTCDEAIYGPKASRMLNPTFHNNHPTLKPILLNQYLAKLILPPGGGKLLNPFSGVCSEAIGAFFAGWDEIVSVEVEAEYVLIAEARVKYWTQFGSYKEGMKNEGIEGSRTGQI